MDNVNIISLFLLICGGTLARTMFSLVAYKNNSVWGSALIHTIWNMFMITKIVSIFNGTEDTDRAIFSILLPSDNMILTGGGFGIEVSMISIIGYATVCAFTLYQMKKQKNLT